MAKSNVIKFKNPEAGSADMLTSIIRSSAREMIACAVESELEAFLKEHNKLVMRDGKQRVVRNGYLPERQLTTGVGAIDVQVPRVRDRSDSSDKITFNSSIVPKHLRRSSSMEDFLPLLYLKGISTNDFADTLAPLLGENAKNISPGVISKLKSKWELEHQSWCSADLSAKNYVYLWADGIYLQARMEESKNCVLVIIGVTPKGNKELVALSVGFRESKNSWSDLLLDMKSRGLKQSPLLAIGDGALGFWGALSEVFPICKHQRCWVHKTANILDKLPKSLQAKAKKEIQNIYNSETRSDARKVIKKFVKIYNAKYPKATECLLKDEEQLLAFYDFPAENWVHIRTTNPIESTFATVRHRTYKAKGCFSQTTILTMVFKLCKGAENRWKKLYGYKQLLELTKGEKFVDGIKAKQTDERTVGKVA